MSREGDSPYSLLYSRLNCEWLDIPRRSLVQHATAGRVSYRLTPWVPNNQNAEVSHNTIRMANSTPPAMGSAQPG
jgi:hypothetical protein